MCEVILGSVPEWGGPVTLEPRLVTAKGDRVVVMLNNLGGLPYIELLIIARRVMTNLRKRGLRPVRAYIGPFMTALEMSGVSVSVFKIDDALLDSLDAPTTAPAWVAAKAISETSGSSSESIPYSGEDYKATVSGGFACPVAIDVAKRISNKINEIEPLLTEYDAVCGDGDCGLVMQAGARRVLADLAAAEDNAVLGIALASDCALLCHHIADSISASMGGTSGAILEIFFRSMATTLSTKVSSLH
jgi:dihydroxyacetone kinase